MAMISTAASVISDACLDPEKLPEALIYCGLLEAVAAFKLIIGESPDGILLQHSMVLFCFYYTFVTVALIFGFFEIFAGLWVSDDIAGRRSAGKKILKRSIVPLVLVLAFVGAL